MEATYNSIYLVRRWSSNFNGLDTNNFNRVRLKLSETKKKFEEPIVDNIRHLHNFYVTRARTDDRAFLFENLNGMAIRAVINQFPKFRNIERRTSLQNVKVTIHATNEL